MTRVKIEKGVRLLVKEAKILKRIGRLRGETRYDFADESLRLMVGNCLAVFNLTMDALSIVWEHERGVNSEERSWLEGVYNQRQANRIISDCYDSLVRNQKDGIVDKEELENRKKWRYRLLLKDVQEIKERCYYHGGSKNNENERNNDKTNKNSLMDRYPFPLQWMIEDMICPSFLGESLGITKRNKV